MVLDPQQVRSNFPSLAGETIFLDNPGGTQVTQSVIDAMRDYFLTANANQGGAFPTSERNDVLVNQARRAFAALLNAESPDEIVFGPNMTTLTFNVSRALGNWLAADDEIIITQLDHDANIAPWRALEEEGIVVQAVDIHPDDCTLNMADFERLLSNKTKIVAVGMASNAVGTVNDVRTIIDLAHMAGAYVYLDAVHYAPHFSIDVRALDCDFLVCSAYKFYGPHLGILYGRYDLLDRLPAYKVRPASNLPPYKFETGTPSFEAITGGRAAVEYIASLGAGDDTDLRKNLEAGMNSLRGYEKNLFQRLMNRLRELPEIRIYGITDAARFDWRAPTVAFNLEGITPRQVAAGLGAQNINVWDGNYYALSVMERLDLERSGGAVRVGLAHYNTAEEVDRFIEELQKIAGG